MKIPPAVAARLLFAGKAFVLTALLAVSAVLVLRAQEHRRGEPRYLVDLAVWSVARSPRWARPDDVMQIRDATGLPGRGLPLFDRAAVDAVRAAIERTPRARRVVSVRRAPPDAIDVVLELRRPVAALAVPGRRWVEVDADGVVLGPPERVRPVRDGVPLRVITGACGAPPAPGGACADDVRDGLALCAQLDGYRDGLGATILGTFDEVDVSNHAGRKAPAEPELVLRSAVSPAGARRTPCIVEWGRLGTRHGEPPFDVKAGRLERAIAIFGDFDGVARVRVAYDALTVLPVDGPEGAWLPALAEQTLGR